jgi:hypothetical protein
MMGHREEKGLYLLAAQHLFSTLRAQGLQLQVGPQATETEKDLMELQVGLSFFEIYADELYDLLNARTKVEISCGCCSCCSILNRAPHPNPPPTPSLSVASRTRGRQKARCCSGLSCLIGNHRHLASALQSLALSSSVHQGLTEKPVRDPQDIMRMMEEGSAQRATGSTGANEWSSRSHAVMQVRAFLRVCACCPRPTLFVLLCSSS